MAITPLPTPPSRNDPTNFAARGDAFLGALPTFGTEANALAVDVNDKQVTASTAATTATTQAGIATTQAGISTTQAGIATTKASEAAASAIAADASAQAAAAIAASFAGTSTSSVAIALGPQTFVTQSGEQYTAGIFVTVVSSLSPSNFMFGQVVSYSGSSLVVDVQSTGGSGTYASWNISLAGVRGAPGTGITDQAIGFTATGGTTARTLTVDATVATSQLQATLVSGTNIKSINGASLLGSGDITVGGSDYTVKSANYTAIASDKILADTSGGSFTITLPASPTTGAVVNITDAAGTFNINALTVARNGSTIMSIAEDMYASTNNATFGLVYNGSTWRII